mmetsp:Transcript_13184/g.1929  ORF Transcript_13184/g.1929 Transcript_13184/m.1929 type:complete len:121 (-) Transcript_13184:76-438(-)
MRKHPSCFHLTKEFDPPLSETTGERKFYDGYLDELCEIAPLNVNTMAVFVLVTKLPFEKIRATLYADPSLEHQITEVSVYGPGNEKDRFSLDIIRKSPASKGDLTSSVTLDLFVDTMLNA